MVEKRIGDKVIRLEQGDITDLDVEAFVFDITEDAKLGSGYGGAIASRAGKVVQEALDEIGCVPTGEAVITTAGKMKAKHIIHLNGPKFFEEDEEAKLRRATQAALQRAEENGITQIAFPPVGTGLYQVDLEVCSRVMVDAVTEHLEGESGVREVVLVALDPREFGPLEKKIAGGA